ncbi:MAG: glycosyltransferase family 4 protein [Mobilitalea sp.]
MRNDKKRKILIVHNYYQIPGGEDTVVANEKKMLENYGHDVVLYSRNNSELKKISKLKMVDLPLTTLFNFRTYREVRKVISDLHIDIVHIHNTLTLISPSVYYAARSMNIPVVQTIHNFRMLCPGATFYRDGHICEECVTYGLSCAVKHSCYRGSKVQTIACVISMKFHRMCGIYGKLNYICLTEFNKEKLLSLKQIKAERVFIKSNFVEVFKPVTLFDNRENQFVFVGRLDKLKGIELLFQAWKKIEESGNAPKLVVCGTGPMEEWCKNYIAKNDLKSIKMLGFVTNTEARKIISISKALILPTQWYEGFPMTIIEAFSVGTPVIGSDMGNVGNIIQEGITGWKFRNNSMWSLVEKVYAFENIIDKVLEKADQYSIESNYKILSHIYENIKKI